MPTPLETTPYHTRDYQSGDEIAIIALFETVFGLPMSLAHWQWKYAGTAGLAAPIVRLAFDQEARLVGHVGAIPLWGSHYGKPLPFFQVCDVMTHPIARGQLGGRNLFTQLMRELQSGIATHWPNAFAYGFPGDRPFRLGKYARVYEEIAQIVSYQLPAQRNRLPLLYTRPLAWDDQRIDTLWSRHAPALGLSLLRDRAYLHWRYVQHPTHHYDLMGIFCVGYLLGWAVTQPCEGTMRVIDICIARRWIKPALTALTRATRPLSRLNIWLPQRWSETLAAHALPTTVIIANMVWQLPISTEQARSDLYYTMGDVDIF